MVNLEFNEEEHKYTIDGEPSLSVTQLIGSMFKPFDADSLAKKLSSFGWARKQGKNEAYWKTDWKKSADHGTEVHEALEDHINKVSNNCNEPKIHQGIRYLETHCEDKELLTELKVCNKEAMLAGTIDLMEVEGNKVIITDWKTNKKLTDKPYEKGDVGLVKPIKHLTNCKVNLYYLQLLTYSYILENLEDKGYEVVGLRLVWLEDDSYTIYEFDIDRELRQKIIDWRIENK